MPITFDTESANTVRKIYRHQAPGDPTVEVHITIEQATNVANMQIRINGATGAAQVKQVLQLIINKISTDFGV